MGYKFKVGDIVIIKPKDKLLKLKGFDHSHDGDYEDNTTCNTFLEEMFRYCSKAYKIYSRKSGVYGYAEYHLEDPNDPEQVYSVSDYSFSARWLEKIDTKIAKILFIEK